MTRRSEKIVVTHVKKAEPRSRQDEIRRRKTEREVTVQRGRGGGTRLDDHSSFVASAVIKGDVEVIVR